MEKYTLGLDRNNEGKKNVFSKGHTFNKPINYYAPFLQFCGVSLSQNLKRIATTEISEVWASRSYLSNNEAESGF